MAITVNGVYDPTSDIWPLSRFFVQLFAAHPDHKAHNQTLTAAPNGGIQITCSCGVQVVVPGRF
jgi:hypothetical protein